MPDYKKQCLFAWVLLFSAAMLNSCASSSTSNSVVQITPTSVLVVPGSSFQFSVTAQQPNVSTDFLPWQVNGVIGGSPVTGTINVSGVYTAPATAPSRPVQIGIRTQSTSAAVSFFDSGQPAQGSIAPTQNPLVAAYSMNIPVGASVSVQFGTDTSYGQSTSSVPAPNSGGIATVLVAGMRAGTTYHMQAIVQLSNGSRATDSDHTFTTGTIPADMVPNIITQFTGIGSQSPGIELLSLLPSASQSSLCAVATDLAGNVVWYYSLPQGVFVDPIKPLPNGHMLLLTGGNANDVREIDLAGNLIQTVTTPTILQSLASNASFANAAWGGLNHDVLQLPNGHWVLLASISKTLENTPGIPPGTVVLGNALIDWDPQKGAVWTWSTFDHIDLSYAPNGLSDWTHGNAVIYSPDDSDLIFSMRNLNWVVKINYDDGAGDGSIVWRFGPNGDFSLPGQQAPIEWNYGQHYPTIQSSNSAGILSLMVFNNGNGRMVDANNDVCGSSGQIACYSSVPIFEIDEYSKTASVVWEDNLSSAYSVCCGDALVLPNGNVEFDVADDLNNPGGSYIEEVTQTQSPELIWRMNIQGQLAYRGIRIPSLYPGQVWPASLQGNLRKTTVH